MNDELDIAIRILLKWTSENGGDMEGNLDYKDKKYIIQVKEYDAISNNSK